MKTTLPVLLLVTVVVNAAESAKTPFSFSGKLLDASGRPVAGGTVTRYEYPQGMLAIPGMDWAPQQQVVTAADGRFNMGLPRTPALFVASKSGLATAWRQSWSTRSDLTDQDLVLTPPAALSGIVVDENANPIPDARVSVFMAITVMTRVDGGQNFNYLSGALARKLFETKSGSDGRFRIEGLPADAGVDLVAQSSGKAIRRAVGDMRGPESMPWHAGESDIKLVMDPAGGVEGKVAEEGGRPISGVQVVLLEAEGRSFGGAMIDPVQTDAEGRFGFKDAAAGSYQVRAVFGPEALPEWVAEPVPVMVERARVSQNIDVKATRGGVVYVKTSSKQKGQPVPNVNVNAFQPSFQAMARSLSNGVAGLRLPPGDYQIYVHHEDFRGENSAVTVRAGETNQLEIALAPPPAVSGIVRRPNGEPAAGVELRVIGSHGGPESTPPRSDAEGRFRLEWDPQSFGHMDAIPCVLARLPADGLAVAQEFDEGATALDLRLAPGITLVGEVKSPNGQPVTNATAALVFWSGNSGMHLPGLVTGTNRPGHFEIPALPPGRRYGLSVSAPGHGQRFINQAPSDGPSGKIELDPIELNVANLKLSGQLLDSDNKPVAGALVNLQGEGQPNQHARTDRDGRFEFPRVCEGPAQIFAHARNAFGNASAHGGETNVVVQLRPQEARNAGGRPSRPVTGKVTGADGAPAAGAKVRLFSQMNFGAPWSHTDTNGAFRVMANAMMRQGGPVWLVAQDSTGQLAAASEVTESATEITLQLEPGGVISGRVENAEGKALEKAEVELMLAPNRMEIRWDPKPVRTDTQGQFQITGLPMDLAYRVYASAPGFGRSRQEVTFENIPNAKAVIPPFSLRPANLLLAGQVLDENDKPVPNAQVQASGTDQPLAMASTDRQGRFKLQVCDGSVRLFVYSADRFSNATFEGGDTNVLVTLSRPTASPRKRPQRPNLQGRPVPDLAAVGLTSDALPAGRPALICLLDWDQRPSRRALRMLADEAQTLKQKGFVVAVIQAVPAADDVWQDLRNAVEPDTFAFGRVSSKGPETRWATQASPLPWLILVDKTGRVSEEGFSPDELNEKAEQAAK